MIEHIFMSYTEAAQRLNIKPDSVRRRARARKWPRRQGNDGKAQVGIPQGLLSPDDLGGAPPGPPTDQTDQTLAVKLAVAEARLVDVTEDRDRLARLLDKALEPRPGLISRLLGFHN